jgi:hypothetical protein
MCFGGGSTPAPPAPIPIPTTSDAEVKAASELERKRRIAAAGRSSTILTSGAGVLSDTDVRKPKLLGGYAVT